MCHVVYVERISSGLRGEFLPVTDIVSRAVTHLNSILNFQNFDKLCKRPCLSLFVIQVDDICLKIRS